MKRHTFTVYVDVDDDAAAAFDGVAVARWLDDVLDNASGLTANLRKMDASYYTTDYNDPTGGDTDAVVIGVGDTLRGAGSAWVVSGIESGCHRGIVLRGDGEPTKGERFTLERKP